MMWLKLQPNIRLLPDKSIIKFYIVCDYDCIADGYLLPQLFAFIFF